MWAAVTLQFGLRLWDAVHVMPGHRDRLDELVLQVYGTMDETDLTPTQHRLCRCHI